MSCCLPRPPNYVPFNIQTIATGDNGVTYVTYAQRDSQSTDTPAIGTGLGLVDVFDVYGNFIKRLISIAGHQLRRRGDVHRTTGQ